MKYLEQLKETFDYMSQVSLINRIMIRLRRESSCLFPMGKYVSEAELNKRIPFKHDIFTYLDWSALREELEPYVIQHASNPTLLKSILIRYMQPFDFSATALFPDDRSSEYDLMTAVILRSLSSYWNYTFDMYDKGAREDLSDYLQKNNLGPVTEELLNAFQQDLAVLHRLMESMNLVAEIIQGLLFEVSASFDIKTLQEESHVKLTDCLTSWKMAPLMGWTTEYCRRIMGDRVEIDLDIENIDTTASPSQVVAVKRKEYLSGDKLYSLGQVLKGEYTKPKQNDGWVFTGPATLFAYMGYKIAEVCQLPSIPRTDTS